MTASDIEGRVGVRNEGTENKKTLDRQGYTSGF